MAFANILTVVTGAADDALALETAARMAHDAQGVVNVIMAPPLLVVDDWRERSAALARRRPFAKPHADTSRTCAGRLKPWRGN